MEDIYNTFASSHNGVSYSTIIIFGSFIFLLLTTFLGQGGRVTEVLRKSSFFSAMLLFVQSILGFLMEYNSPEFVNFQGGYLEFFKYPISTLITAGLMAHVHIMLKKTEVLSLFIVIEALTAALIFEAAYPWSNIFG